MSLKNDSTPNEVVDNGHQKTVSGKKQHSPKVGKETTRNVVAKARIAEPRANQSVPTSPVAMVRERKLFKHEHERQGANDGS